MATLYIDRKDVELKGDGRRILVVENGRASGSVPISNVDRVVIHNKAKFDTHLLGILAENGISMVVLNPRNPKRTAWLHGGGHNDASRRLSQYQRALDPAWKSRFAVAIVARKISGQLLLLRRFTAARPDKRRELTAAVTNIRQRLSSLRIAEDRSPDYVRGLEGAAAAAYFKGLTSVFPPSLAFDGRNRRPPRDPVNACLSLTYTLVHKEAVLACHAAGLDPLIGFFHEPAFGRESLASDLIEPIRPIVDEWVWLAFNERRLRDEHFHRSGGACLLDKSGRARYFQSYESFAGPVRRRLRRYCRIVLRQLDAQ